MAGVVLAACFGHPAPREDDARTLPLPDNSFVMPVSPGRAECRTPCAADVVRAPVEDVVQLGNRANSETCLLQLLSEVAEESGAEFEMDDACRRRLQKTNVFICFGHSVRRSELIEWLTAVLSLADVALVPLDAGSTGARPRWRCIDRRPAAVGPRAAGPDVGK